MNVLALLITYLLGGALAVAGLEKLRARESFRATLSQLALPGWLRSISSLGVPAAELATGTGLFLAPWRTWPLLSAGALSVIFALAGVSGLRAPQPVPCSCLGGTGNGTLGRRQILLLPAWWAGLYVLWRWEVDLPLGDGMQHLTVLIMLLGVARAVSLVSEWRSATGTRSAMQEAITVRAPILGPGDQFEVETV